MPKSGKLCTYFSVYNIISHFYLLISEYQVKSETILMTVPHFYSPFGEYHMRSETKAMTAPNFYSPFGKYHMKSETILITGPYFYSPIGEYHMKSETILMTAPLRLLKSLTSGAPSSPIRLNTTPRSTEKTTRPRMLLPPAMDPWGSDPENRIQYEKILFKK